MIDIPDKCLLPIYSTDLKTRAEGPQVGWAQIKRLIIKPFGQLNDEDATNDGFSSLPELKEALQNIYGNIPDDEPVSIYCFDFIDQCANIVFISSLCIY